MSESATRGGDAACSQITLGSLVYLPQKNHTIQHMQAFKENRGSQWRSKALRGPGSTVTWGSSIPSAGPQGLKLEARSAESGDGTLGREGLLPGLGSGVSRQRQGF